jgi:hypothetical protein
MSDLENDNWHTFHADPVDDLTLKSSDDVLFKASSYKLAKARWVLLLPIPRSTLG